MCPQHPLRCVVLDNDETTGSYRIVLAFLIGLEKVPDLTLDIFLKILERLARFMVKHRLFRPGIEILLETLDTLRKKGRLDAIVMYTNQKEGVINRHNIPLLHSPPQAIAYMLTYIMDFHIFDNILTRTTDKVYIKSFQRILDCFPDHPKDIRKIVFIDDHSTPNFISANGIPENHVKATSWYPISPYSRILASNDFGDCLDYCFRNFTIPEDIYDFITTYYYTNELETESAKDDNELIRLAEYLIHFY